MKYAKKSEIYYNIVVIHFTLTKSADNNSLIIRTK